MAQSQGIASPVTVDLGEEQIQFFPLGLAEWKQMELTLLHRKRERHVSSAWDSTSSLPDDLRRELVKEAVNEAKVLELTPVTVQVEKKTDGIKDVDKDGNPILVDTVMDAVNAWVENTYEGKMFAVWISIKRGRPDVSEQDVSDLLMLAGPAGIEKAFEALLLASGMSDESGNEDGPSSKTK